MAGTEDTTTYRYNAGGELVGVIAPDPDGSGARKRAARRISYDAAGQVSGVEVGTVNGTSDPDWAAFASAQQLTSIYDANERKVRDILTASGTTYGVTQYSYDGLGRLDCAVTRMDSGAWGSLPASACTIQSAADRITKYGYDEVGRSKKVTTGYGTADAADDVTTTYTNNGQTATVADANGNLTSYGYDGFDRLLTTTFPGGSYEQLGYDANGNVTSKRLRDGNVIGYGYDALNRVTSKDLPNIAPHEYDITYAYDNFGNLTQALDSNTHVANFGYNALGRKVSEQSNWATRQWQYDAAGRRTRLTWGDGFYVTYDYDSASNMTAIRENGGTALVTFSYDDLGRRTSLSRANGTVTSYGYDGVSRLSQLVQDLAGTAYDQTVTFSYNPANQITSRTGSNDVYAWTGAANTDRPYTVNGLNQYGAAGGMAFGYDGRGNLTTSGANSYGYTSENKLATAPGGYNMAYDPLGRFHWIANGPVTWMQYDGSDIIEERISSGIARRYVFGPGIDEPLVWYEGAGTSDRRWLHADERGSIVAVSDNAGNAIAINRYDEYGIPQSGNIGRFQYTGQAWIPELGMYHYKARTYSPTLGRFMQTDPIGYADGLNWYNYVGNDPINFVDPTGLQDTSVITARPCPAGTHREKNKGDTSGCVDDAGRYLSLRMPAGQSAGSEAEGTFSPQNNEGEDIIVTATSIDPFSLFNYYLSRQGGTVCLTDDQFKRVTSLASPVGKQPSNGEGLVSLYNTPLENSFGSATLRYRNGKPVGFRDDYDFNIAGANRSFSGHAKTLVGKVIGAAGRDFRVQYPCR